MKRRVVLALVLTGAVCLPAALLALGGAPVKPTATVDDAAQKTLTKKIFPFCMDSEAAMPPRDRRWCEVANQATTCPQIKAMCDREWKGSAVTRWFSRKEGKVDSDSAGGAMDRLSKLPDFKLPDLSFILWIFLGLVLAVVVVFIARAIANRDKPVKGAEIEETITPGLEFADPGLAEMAKLLARAKAESERDVGVAIMLLYAALLRYLEDHGLIHWDVSATNREYVRAVRGKTPLDRPMAEVVREVERSKFGHVMPPRSRFDELYNKITGILGTSAVLLFMVLGTSCAGCDVGDPDLDGHAAFTEIIKSQGITPARLANPIESLTKKDAPVILDVRDFEFDAATLHSIERATLAGARIMVLLGPMKAMPAWPFVAVGGDDGDFISDRLSADGGYPDGAQSSDEEEDDDESAQSEVDDSDGGGVDASAAAVDAGDAGLDAGAVDGGDAGELDAGDADAGDDGLIDAGTVDGGDAGVAVTDGGADAGDGGSVDGGDGGAAMVVTTKRPVRNAADAPLEPTEDWASEAELTGNVVGFLPGTAHLLPPDFEHDPPDVLIERKGKPFAVRWQTSEGELIAVADRRLFSNGAMAVPANAQLAVALAQDLVGGYHTELAYGALSAAMASPSPAHSILNAGLLALLLQALLVLTIVFLSRGLAFGVLRDRGSTGRRAFAEHVRALGQQFANIRGSRFAAALYISYVFERLRTRLGREVDRHDLGAMARVLAQRTGLTEADVTATLEAAEAIRREPQAQSQPDLDLPLMARLGDYLAALQRDSR